MTKRRVCIVLIATILLVFLCLFFGAAAPLGTVKTILETPLYADASYSGGVVLATIKANESLEIIGEVEKDINGVEWVKVRYNSIHQGYVPYRYLYNKYSEDNYEITVMKATGNSTDAGINIYRYFDENSDIVAILYDGEKVNVINEPDKDYGEFVKVLHNGEFCFVKTANVTEGLTYNQKLAAIIAVSLIGLLLVAIVVAVVLFKLKKQGKFNHK